MTAAAVVMVLGLLAVLVGLLLAVTVAAAAARRERGAIPVKSERRTRAAVRTAGLGFALAALGVVAMLVGLGMAIGQAY